MWMISPSFSSHKIAWANLYSVTNSTAGKYWSVAFILIITLRNITHSKGRSAFSTVRHRVLRECTTQQIDWDVLINHAFCFLAAHEAVLFATNKRRFFSLHTPEVTPLLRFWFFANVYFVTFSKRCLRTYFRFIKRNSFMKDFHWF